MINFMLLVAGLALFGVLAAFVYLKLTKTKQVQKEECCDENLCGDQTLEPKAEAQIDWETNEESYEDDYEDDYAFWATSAPEKKKTKKKKTAKKTLTKKKKAAKVKKSSKK